jgi:hypothetical protein
MTVDTNGRFQQYGMRQEAYRELLLLLLGVPLSPTYRGT